VDIGIRECCEGIKLAINEQHRGVDFKISDQTMRNVVDCSLTEQSTHKRGIVIDSDKIPYSKWMIVSRTFKNAAK